MINIKNSDTHKNRTTHAVKKKRKSERESINYTILLVLNVMFITYITSNPPSVYAEFIVTNDA